MWRTEDGFSLAELLVAIIVGSMVLGAGYLLIQTGYKSFRDIENTTTQTRDAGTVMDTVSRDLREGTGLTKADPYEIEFLADADDDGIIERWRFYIDAGSSLVKRDRIDAATNGVQRTDTIARFVRNRINGVPVFTYYAAPGQSLSGTATVNAHLVHMKVITQRQVPPIPVPYTAELDVFLRNAPTN